MVNGSVVQGADPRPYGDRMSSNELESNPASLPPPPQVSSYPSSLLSPFSRKGSRPLEVTRNTGVEFAINVPSIFMGRSKKRRVVPSQDDDDDDVDEPQPGILRSSPPPPIPSWSGHYSPGPPPNHPPTYPPPYRQHTRSPPITVQAAPRSPNEPEILEGHLGPAPVRVWISEAILAASGN